MLAHTENIDFRSTVLLLLFLFSTNVLHYSFGLLLFGSLQIVYLEIQRLIMPMLRWNRRKKWDAKSYKLFVGHFEIGEKCFFSFLDMILRFCTPSYMDGDGFFETVQKVRAGKEARWGNEEKKSWKWKSTKREALAFRWFLWCPSIYKQCVRKSVNLYKCYVILRISIICRVPGLWQKIICNIVCVSCFNWMCGKIHC